MPYYCDSKQLELNWLRMILSKQTPQLDVYRSCGLLWTKNCHPKESNFFHFIQIHEGFFVESSSTNILKCTDVHGVEVNLPKLPNLPNLSASPSKSFFQQTTFIDAWQPFLADIKLICDGVSTNFYLTDEQRSDLSSEALLQIIGKYERGTLNYEPGKAPVFNLLTTATYRCMLSLLNKNKRYGERIGNYAKHLQDIS